MSRTPRTADRPWYREGLKFTCTRCGDCCTGAPGFVWVDAEEIARLAESRGEGLDEFGRQFLRRVGDRISLVEKPGGDCIFWERGVGCTVYDVRPVQCRTWPFWPENVETRQDWDRTRAICPGSGHGQWHSLESIEAALKRTPG